MTAFMRLRLSARALSSLGLLMAAVVIGIGAAASCAQGSADPARAAVVSGGLASTGERATSSTGFGGTDFALRPHHLRPLVGAVVLIALPSGSQPYWALVLGLGLYLSAAADRNRPHRLFCGCRHGTRAPPLRS